MIGGGAATMRVLENEPVCVWVCVCVCVRVRVCVCISYVCARFCKRALFLQGSFPNKIFHFLEYHSDISTLSLFDFDLSVFI